MSKFCIDLKGADLADIVDQICIAWHGANCKAQTEITADWAERLRKQIKSKHGKGWSLDAVGESKFNPHGKCRMQYKNPNQKGLELFCQLNGVQKTLIKSFTWPMQL